MNLFSNFNKTLSICNTCIHNSECEGTVCYGYESEQERRCGMKLIIDIDEEMYKRICEAQSVPDMYGTDIVNAITRIQNGEVLPDNHGLQQGEWIVLVDADNIQTCKCSICGRIADIANREFEKFPYCHCGAKMKGGAE